MEYWFEFRGQRHVRKSGKLAYRYANAYEGDHGELSFTWHTSVDAASKAEHRVRHDWSDRRKNVGYLIKVYSDDHQPDDLWTTVSVFFKADWAAQQKWIERGNFSSREELAGAFGAILEQAMKNAVEELAMVKELGVQAKVNIR